MGRKHNDAHADIVRHTSRLDFVVWDRVQLERCEYGSCIEKFGECKPKGLKALSNSCRFLCCESDVESVQRSRVFNGSALANQAVRRLIKRVSVREYELRTESGTPYRLIAKKCPQLLQKCCTIDIPIVTRTTGSGDWAGRKVSVFRTPWKVRKTA